MKTYEPKLLQLWTMPESYAGTVWPATYSAGVDQNRDSDALGRSNFDTAWKALRAVSEDVEIVREGHWAVGWVEWIAIPADDATALKVADDLLARIEDYPVLNETDLTAKEHDEAQEVWANCYSPKDRIAYIREHESQFEFCSLSDLLGCVRGTYFAGYASELISR